MTRPAARAVAARGAVIRRNSCNSEAPSTRAAASRSRSTFTKPVRAERMKNGAETKVWARITATIVNGIPSPSGSPISPRRPNTRSRPRPATAGGRTIGRSTIVSTSQDPRNVRRAINQASGRPNITVSTRLIEVVTRLRIRASSTTGVVSASVSEPSRVARAIRTTTGNPRNSNVRPATSRTVHPPNTDTPGPSSGRSGTPLACDPCRCAAVGARCHGGGRKPNEDRTSCPSGPISQSRNAAAASWFGDSATTTPA